MDQTLPTEVPRPARRPLRKRMERAAGRVALGLIVGPLRRLPLSTARVFGKGLGLFIFRSLGRYRRVALKNLNLVYAERSDRERQEMARAVFRHFGEMAAEFLKIPQMDRRGVDRLVTVEGEENLQAALGANKGVLLITGHFGNWEFMARWLTTHDYPLNVVARKANDPKADRLLTDTREDNGAQVLNRGNSARAVLQCLKRGEIVALLPDQNAADVFVPFLGLPTGTVHGPAILHLKTQAPLLFSWCVRTPDDKFQITFAPPETFVSTGERNKDIVTVMTRVNACLEAQVRRNPTQWLWLHDRWKASPGVFPDGVEHVDAITTLAKKYPREKAQPK